MNGAKRIVFIAVWAVAFFFGSAMLLGFASGLFFAAQASEDGQVSDRTMMIIGTSWAIVPMISGPIGLLLGILGKLPGTRGETTSAVRDPYSKH